MKTFPLLPGRSRVAAWRCAAALAALLAANLPGAALADAIDDYNVALNLYKQQRWDLAEAEFRKFVDTYATHERTAAARLYLGQSLVHQKKFDAARSVFRTFVERHREHPDLYLALYRIGESSYFLGEYDAARKELDRFVSAFPEHELTEYALQYLGESQLRIQDPKSAIATLQLQLNRFPTGRLAEDAKFLQARAKLAAGDRDGARAQFETLAAKADGNRAADAQVQLAMLLYDDRQFADARAAFDVVRQKFPESALVPLADLNAGYAAYHLGEFDVAAERFDLAAQAPGQADEARFWKGMSQKSQENYAAAAETFQALAEAVDNAELAAKAQFHRADAVLRQGEYDLARELFLKVADAAPQGPLAADSLHLATEAAILAGDLDAATELHARFERDYSESGLWLLQRLLQGRIQLARGDVAEQAEDEARSKALYEEAAQVFAAVVQDSQVQRTSLLARLLLARAQDRLQQHAAVIETLAPVVEHLQQPGTDAEFAEALVLQGRNYLRLDRGEDAARVSQLFVDRFSDRPLADDALANLALAHARLDHAPEVDSALNQLWEKEGERPVARRTTYELADRAYAAKDWARAASLFRLLLEKGAGEHQFDVLSGLGYSLHESGEHAEAAEIFKRLATSVENNRPLASDAVHMQALSLQQAGDLDAAAAAFESAIEQFSLPADAKDLSADDIRVVSNVHQSAKGLARVRRDQQQRDAADKAYQTAFEQLQLLPDERQQDLDRLLNEWALLHYEAQNYARSDELFSRLLELRPSSDLADDARLYLGESHFFADRFDEASKAFTSLADGEQVDDFVRHRALVLLIDIAERKEDWENVITRAETLAQKFPESDQKAYSHYRLGEAYLKSGKPEEAIRALTPVHDTDVAGVRAAEWFPSVRLLLAEAYLRTKNYPQVEAVAARFREEQPQSPFLHQIDEILGRRFKNTAQWEESREAFQRVIDSPSGRRTETAAKAQLMIAETYLNEERFEDAFTAYYKVYANYKFPEYQAPALFQAAQCDAQLNRWDGAVKTYETLLQEFPESEFAEKAKPLLETARVRASTAPAADDAADSDT